MMTQSGTFESGWDKSFVSAEGKDVIVIGGGDTGTDCIATSVRHRCKSVVNFELMPRPPDARAPANPWPQWPRVYGLDYGHAEVVTLFGKDPRQYSLLTTEFKGENGQLKSLVTQEVKVGPGGVTKVPGTETVWPADLVIIAMGFVSPETSIHQKLNLDLDSRNNIHAEYGDYRTSVEGVFAAGKSITFTLSLPTKCVYFFHVFAITGDCRRGQSLVVWAINEGRGVADKCNQYLLARMEQQQPVFDEKQLYIG